MIEDAGYSAKDLKRPGIKAALEELERGGAGALVVAKLDRLSRSMLDFTALMAQAQKRGWALVALDCAVDTTTPAGEAMANVLATFAQFERRLIGARTKEGMAAKRAAGTLVGPVGRPRSVPETTRRSIIDRRNGGLSYAAIAAQLTAEGIPTAQGGRAWFPGTVRKIILAEERDADEAASLASKRATV